MACYARPARNPLGHGLDPKEATKCDVQTKNRKRKPQKGNDEISSKRKMNSTGSAWTSLNRSVSDSVEAHGLICDLSKSVPRKELTSADGSIDDHSSKFSEESSFSLSSSSSSSNDLSSNDESNSSSSSSNDLSSDDKRNHDEKIDVNATSEVLTTKIVYGLEINLERFHDPNIEILPHEPNAARSVQRGHPLAKKLPLQLNFRHSASQRLM
jgi:hypothetical protein